LVQIFYPVPCSQTPSVYIPPLMSQTKFHCFSSWQKKYLHRKKNSIVFIGLWNWSPALPCSLIIDKCLKMHLPWSEQQTDMTNPSVPSEIVARIYEVCPKGSINQKNF
jgi:hypothetical protein